MLCLVFIIGTIGIYSKNVNAADVYDKPHFTVKIDSISPNAAKVGEDIIVKGTITPQDFENAIQKKQIVLVIDNSGSMSNNGSTKLANLKTAAVNFINKMSSLPNTEMAIVEFREFSYINPRDSSTNKSTSILKNYQQSFIPLNTVDNINALKYSVNNGIKAGLNEGTNTGEGLRKATYLLSQSNNGESKTIIFMSDGEASFYDGYNITKTTGTISNPYSPGTSIRTTLYKDDGYYMKIDGNDPASNLIGGSGMDKTDYQGKCIDYAKQIGALIKRNGYNAFTIGYGLDSLGNTKMKAIHSSMSNNASNYFAVDTGAIDGVYNTIADKIINSYTLTSITLNLNLSADFILNYGGDAVNIENVTYTKRTDITDKIVYHAEPIPFEFTIRGSKNVTDYNILQGATLVVPWNGGQITDTVIPDAKVTIIENDLPNIKVNLYKINDQTYSPNQAVTFGQPIKVTYQVTTQDTFKYNINNSLGGVIDDAVFVVDLSKDMNLDERWGIMKNEFTNVILRGDTLKGKNIKLGVVGYNDSVINPIETGAYNRLFNRNNDSENEKLRLLLQEAPSDNHEYVYPNADKEDRSIGPALKKADQLLQEYADANENKAIVLVNSGDVEYNQEDINAIKNKGYKIISLDMSCIKNQPVPTSNLHTLHLALNGNDNDYFVSTRDTNGSGNFNNDNYEMTQIANSLKGGTSPKQLVVSGAKLNFDLGENFETPSNSGLDGTGNIRTVTLPDIKYTLAKNDNGDYVWTQMDPDPIEVSFYVQAVSGKTGQLGFANDTDSDPVEALKNFVSYNRFDGTLIKKHIDTPVVTMLGGAVPKITAQAVNPRSNVGIFKEMPLVYHITAESFPDSLIPENQQKQNAYSFTTTLKFHTGGNFQGVSGFKLDNNDAWYDLETVPFQVNYRLVDHTYVADSVSNIALTVKPKLKGNLTFGNTESENDSDKKFPGAVSYTNLFNNQVLNKIDEFNLNVSQIVDHGIYQGINNGELSVIPNNAELPRGAIANLAMGSIIDSSNAVISLQVNSNIDIISSNNPIKIYRIVNGNLSIIENASYTSNGINGDYNNYTINLPQGINSETKLVIMYQSKIPQSSSSEPFINKAIINGAETDFTLNISINPLPDLF